VFGRAVFGGAVFNGAIPAKKIGRGFVVGAAGLGACALVAACSPVKAGAAAIVGNDRITVTSLDDQVANLQSAAKANGGTPSLTAAEAPAAVLTWLVRFDIMDQLAAANGISLTQADDQAGLADIKSEAASSASQDGFSSANALLLGNGLSPQMQPALGRWVAQENAYALKVNGGKPPTTTAENTAVTGKYDAAECQAAKALGIQVSPQFGRLDYSTYTIVAAPNLLSAPAGKPSPAPTAGLAPAC
jgi:hypothetical protein